MKKKLLAKSVLKEAAKTYPTLLDEVDRLIAKAVTEESLAVQENFKQELGISINSGGRDGQYRFYEGFKTPTNVKLDMNFINGYTKEEIDGEKTKRVAEDIKFENISVKEDLKAIYESFTGGDASSTSLSTAQTGIPLKKRQTDAELRLVQLITNSRYNADPFVGNGIDNIARYIVGSGLRVSVEQEQVDDCIEKFLRQVKLADLFTDFIKTTFKDGEAGNLIKSKITKGKNPKVDWSMHKVFSEEIRGFEVHKENPGKRYSYWREVVIDNQNKFKIENKWFADIDYFYQFNTRGTLTDFDGAKSEKEGLTKEAVIAWFTHGDKRECRGRVPLERSLRDFRLLEDFRINRAIMNYERSKVLYMFKQKQQVNRIKTSTEIRKSASPRGGTQINLGPTEDYEMLTATLNASDADVDGLLFLYAAGSGISTPIYILGMRADQQNYSAIKNTDSPFNQMILEIANDFIAYLKNIFKWVIYRNIEAGVLENTITISKIATEKEEKIFKSFGAAFIVVENNKAIINKLMEKVTKENLKEIDKRIESIKTIQQTLDAELKDAMQEIQIPTLDLLVNITLADAVKPNPLELAKVAFIERKLSIVSSQTLSERRGNKWPQEVKRMLNEISLKLWMPQEAKMGQQDSSNSGATGTDQNVDGGDGTTGQNTK
jgi:hypothetical protein